MNDLVYSDDELYKLNNEKHTVMGNHVSEKVTIGISCYGNHKILRIVLDSLIRNTPKSLFQLYIMNDDPHDNTMSDILNEYGSRHNI